MSLDWRDEWGFLLAALLLVFVGQSDLTLLINNSLKQEGKVNEAVDGAQRGKGADLWQEENDEVHTRYSHNVYNYSVDAK